MVWFTWDILNLNFRLHYKNIARGTTDTGYWAGVQNSFRCLAAENLCCMQNWDFFGTKFGPWSHLGPTPKFGTSSERLITVALNATRTWYAVNTVDLGFQTFLPGFDFSIDTIYYLVQTTCILLSQVHLHIILSYCLSHQHYAHVATWIRTWVRSSSSAKAKPYPGNPQPPPLPRPHPHQRDRPPRARPESHPTPLPSHLTTGVV